MASGKKVPLNLVVDKEKNEVVWADSGEDFVDVLFSFLTLPLGTVVRLLRKQSRLGRVDELYKSVEDLDESYFRTECCKGMLLCTRSSSERHCEDRLPVQVDDADTRTFYTCRDKSCLETKYSTCVYSAVEGACCRCGGIMNRPVTWERSSNKLGNGVFVGGGGRFTISDDLYVTPVSASTTMTLLGKCGSKDGNVLEHMYVELTREQVLTLLGKSVSSKTPLTEMFLKKPECQTMNVLDLLQKEEDHLRTKEESKTRGKEFKARLVMSKAGNKVLYAEVGEDVLDLVFSFLTIPFGSIIRLLEKGSHIGCMDNLYKSVEKLCATKYCAKLEQHKDMLLAPKIAPHFGCGNQLLEVDEMTSSGTTMNACACRRCAVIPAPVCIHGKETVRAVEINPKLGNGGTEKGGGFTKGRPGVFMMTDEMVVTLNSSVSSLQVMHGLKISIDDLEEREVTFGEKEALDLLRALLLSRTPLTDVFYPRRE